MQHNNNKIIVGIKINDKLQDNLDSSKTSVKPYFMNNDPEYLQVLQIDSDDYIVKIANSGVSYEILSNLFLNFKTMLKMICPEYIISDDAIKIYAYTS